MTSYENYKAKSSSGLLWVLTFTSAIQLNTVADELVHPTIVMVPPKSRATNSTELPTSQSDPLRRECAATSLIPKGKPKDPKDTLPKSCVVSERPQRNCVHTLTGKSYHLKPTKH